MFIVHNDFALIRAEFPRWIFIAFCKTANYDEASLVPSAKCCNLGHNMVHISAYTNRKFCQLSGKSKIIRYSMFSLKSFWHFCYVWQIQNFRYLNFQMCGWVRGGFLRRESILFLCPWHQVCTLRKLQNFDYLKHTYLNIVLPILPKYSISKNYLADCTT